MPSQAERNRIYSEINAIKTRISQIGAEIGQRRTRMGKRGQPCFPLRRNRAAVERPSPPLAATLVFLHLFRPRVREHLGSNFNARLTT
jgi:hypothetical protein